MSRHTPETFWAKVDRGAPDECWLWKGSLTTWGYGDCYYQGRRTNASRIAYEIAHGRVAKHLVVCHTCDTPACCNPAHLWVGTPRDNVRDCNSKGRGRTLSGAEHPRAGAKLTPEQVLEARREYAAGVTQTELGRRYGVHSATISRAVRGENWPHLK